MSILSGPRWIRNPDLIAEAPSNYLPALEMKACAMLSHRIYFRTMKKSAILFLLVVILACGGAALYWTAASRAVQTVRTVQVRLSALHSSVSTNGIIEADHVFELHAPFPGLCRRISVKDGEKIRAGQVILTIDDASVQADLASARAELETAQVEMRNVRRGPPAEEVNSAEAEIGRLRLELEDAQKNLTTNQWLLERSAIARFEVEESQRHVASAQHALAAALRRRDDLKTRYDAADLQHATVRVGAAKARISYLEVLLSRSVVRAPVPGTLYQFKVKEGAYLNAGDLIGLCADLSQLRARVFVDEADLGRVSVDDDIEIRWNAHPDQVWKGKVQQIPSEVVARGTRSVAEVLCAILSPPGALIPSINVDAEIIADHAPKVVSLPRGAIISDGKDQTVWLAHQGKAVKRHIETGQSTSKLIEITTGLSVGDQVIIPGEAPIAEGMKIRVTGE